MVEKRICQTCGPVSRPSWEACVVTDCPEIAGWYHLPEVTEPEDSSDKPDPIASPPHYRSHPSGVEALTITEHHSFCLGNTIKYLWRAGQKEGEDLHKDLAKAWFYLSRECLRLGVDLPDLTAISKIDGIPSKS